MKSSVYLADDLLLKDPLNLSCSVVLIRIRRNTEPDEDNASLNYLKSWEIGVVCPVTGCKSA